MKTDLKAYWLGFEKRAVALMLKPFEIRACELSIKPYEDRVAEIRYNHNHGKDGKFTSGGTKGIDKSFESDIIINKSVGAKAKNYMVLLPDDSYVPLAEGTRITDIKVIAGKGVTRQIDEIDNLLKFGGKKSEWKKLKGIGFVDLYGEIYKTELHWYQEPTVGKVKFKVKSYNGEWIIDD